MDLSSKAMICPACSQPLGSNKDCEECLKYMIEEGKKGIDEEEAKGALERAIRWLATKGKKAPKVLYNQVKLMVEMIGDYFRGVYTEIPWEVIAAVVFAIVYVINPFDLVPDFIPFLGWIDDTSVMGLIVLAIGNHLRKYADFKGYKPDEYGFGQPSDDQNSPV